MLKEKEDLAVVALTMVVPVPGVRALAGVEALMMVVPVTGVRAPAVVWVARMNQEVHENI